MAGSVGSTSMATLLYLIDIRMNSQAKAMMTELDKRLQSIEQRMNRVNKATQKTSFSLMGFGLSVLFGGMAIKMLATNILTSLVTAFVTARDEGDFLVNRLLAMQASLEFLKFAIFDAFAQSELFMNMTTSIIDMTNALGMFIAQRPGLASFIVVSLGVLIILGAIGMVLGQLSLLAVGFGVSLGPIIGIILVLSAAFGGIFALLNSNVPDVIKMFGSMGIALGAILIIAALLGATIGLPFIIIAAVVIAVIGTLGLLDKKLGGIGNAFKALGIFILFVLANIADGIINLIVIPLNAVIMAINAVIRASNRFLGTNFSEIEYMGGSNLAAKVDAMRDDLIAENQPGWVSGNLPEKESTGTTNIFNIDNAYGDDTKLMKGIEDVLKTQSDTLLGSVNKG